MKKSLIIVVSILGGFAISGCTTTSHERTAYTINQKGQKNAGSAYECPDLKIHRQAGILQPGTVLMTEGQITGQGRTPQEEVYIKGCNEGRRTVYAGSHDPSLQLSAGITKVIGGEDNINVSSSATGGQSVADATGGQGGNAHAQGGAAQGGNAHAEGGSAQGGTANSNSNSNSNSNAAAGAISNSSSSSRSDSNAAAGAISNSNSSSVSQPASGSSGPEPI